MSDMHIAYTVSSVRKCECSWHDRTGPWSQVPVHMIWKAQGCWIRAYYLLLWIHESPRGLCLQFRKWKLLTIAPNMSKDLRECVRLLPLNQDAPAQTCATSSTPATVAATALAAGNMQLQLPQSWHDVPHKSFLHKWYCKCWCCFHPTVAPHDYTVWLAHRVSAQYAYVASLSAHPIYSTTWLQGTDPHIGFIAFLSRNHLFASIRLVSVWARLVSSIQATPLLEFLPSLFIPEHLARYDSLCVLRVRLGVDFGDCWWIAGLSPHLVPTLCIFQFGGFKPLPERHQICWVKESHDGSCLPSLCMTNCWMGGKRKVWERNPNKTWHHLVQ